MHVLKRQGVVTLLGERATVRRRGDGSFVIDVDGGAGWVHVNDVDVHADVECDMTLVGEERAAALQRLEQYTRRRQGRVPEQRRAGRD